MYTLMFFICGFSNGGGVYCSWKEAMDFKDLTTCRQVLTGDYTYHTAMRIGQSPYLMAGCFAKSQKVEK